MLDDSKFICSVLFARHIRRSNYCAIIAGASSPFEDARFPLRSSSKVSAQLHFNNSRPIKNLYEAEQAPAQISYIQAYFTSRWSSRGR